MPDSSSAPRAYDPLPLGAIEPRGWLRRQLEIQADGLTGDLDACWPDIADNQWLGGCNDGWERGPYYADGLVPLAHLLDDRNLLAKAEPWVEAFIESQDDDGWIGPAEQIQDQGYERDPWPRFIVLKVLRQHYEATGDERAIDTMLSFCRHLRDALEENPLQSWAHYRWADLVVGLLWLHDRTGEDWLLDVGAVAARQGYAWHEHFADFHDYRDPYEAFDEEDLSAHGVNNAMGLKAPAVRGRLPVVEASGADAREAIDTLDTFHGQVSGVFASDEYYGGKHPSRGTELCTVVEYMYSLEVLATIHGDARFGDRLERIAYNALPATFTPDMTAHQYNQQANQPICNVAHKGWYNGPEANIFGLEPNFGCCTANFHQGWPKFASHLWMRDGDELATVAYAPCSVTTTLGGEQVTIEEETAYPFDDAVSFRVDASAPASFGLSLRIPSWVERATVMDPSGESTTIEDGGTYYTVEREWQDVDTLEITFESPLRAERRYHGGVSLHRGPLTFALPIEAEWNQIGGEVPYADWELYPDKRWSYALDLDVDTPAESVSLEFDGPNDMPFSPDDPPVLAETIGHLVPEWGLDSQNAWAESIPDSYVSPDEPDDRLTLVPYGCTNLRLAEFPLVA